MNRTKRQNLPVDAVIFDMDGVLVDVSTSYREAIIQTVEIFFATGLGLGYDDDPIPLIDKHDVHNLKMAGGFNNDWDLTRGFIIYFLEMLPPLGTPTFPLKKYVPAILAYLQVAGGGHLPITIDMLRKNKDIRRLARKIEGAGGGLAGLDKILTHRNRHLVTTGDDPLKGNLIQRIFQEIYLGQKLFEEIYEQKAVVIHTNGLINTETLLIDPTVLHDLAAEINLGIATGRPKREAEYTLARLGLTDYFQSLVTYDDIILAEAKGKPDPWSLLEAARRLHPTPTRTAYIGDTPDDILAAKAANQTVPFLGIACLSAAEDKDTMRQHFEENGADMILSHPDRLREVIFR